MQLDVTLLPELGVDVDLRDDEQFNEIINLGYRAQLVTENFITGLKYIEIDIDEGSGRPVFHQENVVYKEFPTKPSLTATLGQIMEDMIAKFEDLDVKAINDNLVGVLERAREGIDEIEFARLNASFAAAAESAQALLDSPKIQLAIDNINSTLEEYEGLAEDIRAKIQPVLDKAEETNRQLQATLAKFEGVAAELELMLTPESAFRYQLDQTLVELEETLTSARLLVEQLERSPKSLLTGKELPGTENTSKKKKK
jgi:paraquat-inducible protein B